MKKFTIISALVLSLGVATPAFAQDSVRTGFEARTAELKEKIRESQERLQESREKLNSSFMKTVKVEEDQSESNELRMKADPRASFRASLAKHSADIALKVFDATIERLEVLIVRIESRIDKVRTEGKPVAEAEASVAEAKAFIEHAKEHLTTIGAFDIASTTEARDTFEVMKGEVKEARESLVEAKHRLQNAVQSLKGLE